MLIPADVALDLVADRRLALIDVRSEGEFAHGHVEGFALAPILRDPERHLVGIEYKKKGQEAAIALGHRLVSPYVEERVAQWRSLTHAAPERAALVTCWRGGLRSKLAWEQLQLAGERATRVEGGYKAMRGVLLQAIAAPPPLLVLGGLTGSGKTRLLRELPLREAVDLEGFARHRGSSFGGLGESAPQPSQATFENLTAMRLRHATRPILLEDESVMIGRLRLPPTIYLPMQTAPVVFLEAPLAIRVRDLHAEYVEAPLRAGVTPQKLGEDLALGTRRLARRLGSEFASRIEHGVTLALAAGHVGLDAHAPWIELLLTEYYDKSYRYAFARSERKTIFRGDYEECRQWIMHRYA